MSTLIAVTAKSSKGKKKDSLGYGLPVKAGDRFRYVYYKTRSCPQVALGPVPNPLEC